MVEACQGRRKLPNNVFGVRAPRLRTLVETREHTNIRVAHRREGSVAPRDGVHVDLREISVGLAAREWLRYSEQSCDHV